LLHSLLCGARDHERVGASLRGGLTDCRARRIRGPDIVTLSLIVCRLLARSPGLAALARQLPVRPREFLAACPAGGRGRLVKPRNGHAVAGTRDVRRARSAIGRAAKRCDRHAAEAEDRLRALGSAMRDDGDAATQANRRDRRSNRSPFRMRSDASDHAQYTLAQRKSELAIGRGGIVNEAVDHKRRVGADIEGRLVDEQHLDAAGRGGLNLLILYHLGPDLDHSRGAAERRARGGRVDRAGRADGIGAGGGRQRENRAKRNGGEQQRKRLCAAHSGFLE
jgi:hypothetical protein